MFVQMKSQLLIANIIPNETRYNYVIHCLDFLSEVNDIVNPPTTNKYALKDRLIKSFADSAEKKLRKLLNKVVEQRLR